MTERWRPIADHWGYEVSDQGRVKCRRPKQPGTLPLDDGRIVNIKIGTGGYPYVHLGFNGPTPMVHRLVAEAFVRGRRDGLEVAHINGIRTDCRAENLRWDTRKGNHADKLRHGTWGRKLTADQVAEIRRLYSHGEEMQKDIAKRFGISQTYVSKLCNLTAWKELDD